MQEAEFSGRAVVTGAGQGIGRAIALRLLAAGCTVQAIGRSGDKLATLAEEAGVTADKVIISALDIQDSAAVGAALTEAAGPLRYLVNSAGVLKPSRLLEVSEAELREIIDINLTATLVLTQKAARFMATERQGAIVTIGSNSGTTPRTALGAYPASKAGLAHAMKCLGLELADYGVRCNIVSPGSTDTEMQRSFQSDASSLDRVLKGDPEMWRLGIPLRRMADPDDVTDLVLFLLSEKARHITMENIVIDGGATLGAR
ncbi:SDR family NAD(P)-dependent oxidoreductase [uncultured Roseovarius sp.]|uniref:SDR family NAD(P)-dependent oxidoreductase n=1 Tax=uncultured Roseovarius sp. TaxID=293344 RepID=UPI00260DD31F|nr:SDR family NAD(P)-dependent oxidoreductase [uncultured Roseovarius sp.]